MKLSKIALSCALACTAMSAQAASVPVPVGTTTVYLSGATAPDNFLQDIATNLLQPGFISATSGTNYRAFLGKAAAIPGVTNGTDILFIKRSKGGSVWGVDPVARANRIETIDLSSCTLVNPTTYINCAVKGIDPGLAGNADLSNPGIVSDFGVSDVEAKMFKFPFNTENDQSALTAEEVAVLQPKPINQIMMGIVATNAVPAATYISRSAYGAMLAGKIRSWDQLDANLSGPVTVCRRVDGSGTQTSYNWFFSGFPCNATDSGYLETPPASVTDSDSITGGTGTSADPFIIDPSGYTVFENSTSGDVRNCLNKAQSGGVHKVRGENDLWYQVTFPANTKAIGVLSLDSYKDVTVGTTGWNFRMLDGAGTYTVGKNVGTTPVMNADVASAGATGIAPSKDNLLNGKYDFTVELSMQYRKDPVTNVNGDTVIPLTAPANATKLAVVNEFIIRAGDTRYTGNDGIAAAGLAATSVPKAYASLPQYFSYTTKPLYVSKYSRNANTCAPLIRY